MVSATAKSAAINDGKQSDETFTRMACGLWSTVQNLQRTGNVALDGSKLDIGSVVAVARTNCEASIDTEGSLVEAMENSIELLEDYLSKGYYVYGVNTGFGGSADSRTTDLSGLQSSLLQHTQSGVLVDGDLTAAAANEHLTFHSMPVSWTRATMVVRCNNALRGHSGVRLKLVEAILKMLNLGMTPVIPLRGSISASGDLMPLSYIAGMLEGSPDIYVRTSDGPNTRIVTAGDALQIAGIEPFTLGPKEGLGLINGTAASAGVGCLAVYETSQLALLAQMLTAMSCEALSGKDESFHPFIASVRPHPGQIECASNILKFVQGSSLAEKFDSKDRFLQGLFQDRYALRGASQWLGPQLEDLSLALSQLTVELNSTSDNPVIDTASREVLSGANFQAASVASAMDRSRLCLQMMGKLLFSLSSELINPDLNKGLPANLAADDPSLSFTMKGVDVNMASYMSELAFLANPVTSHVQSAEMNNQPINSLAMISARYTMQATELVALMCATHLYVVCQALDLRVLHRKYLQQTKDDIWRSAEEIFAEDRTLLESSDLKTDLAKAISASWGSSTTFDVDERCRFLGDAVLPVMVRHASKSNVPYSLPLLEEFREGVQERSRQDFGKIRKQFFAKQDTAAFLGAAAARLYSFVRQDLGVPFHQGLDEHPGRGPAANIGGRSKKTIGSWVSIIYKAIRDGNAWTPIVDVLRTDDGHHGTNGASH